MESFTKLPTYIKIILIISVLAILGILIYTLVSIVSVNKKIKELDTKTGEARIKSLIDKFTENQQEQDVSTESQDIQANNINVREKLTSRNIDVSENLSADNINVGDNMNVKNLNVSGNISSNVLIEKIKEHSDKYVRYLEVNLTDQELYDKNKFYPLLFASGNSGLMKVIEFTISSHSGQLELSNPTNFEKTINQNLLKFIGQGGGSSADISFAETFYTYVSDDIPIGSSSLRPGRTYGPIVSSIEKMINLIDIAKNKPVYNPNNFIVLYVRGCNRYYIRTNAVNVVLMDKGGRIDNISGCFINILELNTTTDGFHELVDDTTKELPTYNTNLKLNNTTENSNPGLELFWNGISAGRGKFFYSELQSNMDFSGNLNVSGEISGNISNNQYINLNYGSNFKSVSLDANGNRLTNGNIPTSSLVVLYNCISSTSCDTSLSINPIVFKSIIFDSITKPKLSGLSYSNNNVNGILTVTKTGFYEIDMNLLFFVLLNKFGTSTNSLTKLNRLQVPPAVTIKLADISSFINSNGITSSSSPTILEEFICIINNSFTIDETCTSTSTVPKFESDCRILSGTLRDSRVVNLTAGKSYSFIILRPNLDLYKLKYGTDSLNNDRGLAMHKVSKINIKLLSY